MTYLSHRIIFLLAINLAFAGLLHAAPKRHVIENNNVRMVIIPRTAQQMAAFYEGREFPKEAINATDEACFFTVGIHNKSRNILWLNTNNWDLNTSSDSLSLLSREYWTMRWKELNIPQRFQSTFRWTLLPSQLDFQEDEREGGNITLARTNAPFTLTARFNTGADKKGMPINIVFNNLSCAKDKKP